MKFQDLSGQIFEKWTVIRRVKIYARTQTIWECQCECGQIKQVYASHLIQGNSKSCGCNRKVGAEHKQWKGCGDISGNYWDGVKRGASGKKGRRKPLPFYITIEYAWDVFLRQNRKCALTGLPLVINYARKTGPIHNASLDRIDSAKGYIQDNIQWVHKDINIMKNAYDQDYYIDMCNLVGICNRRATK